MAFYIDSDKRDRTSTDKTAHESIISYKPASIRTVQLVELTDECIDKIANEVAQKILNSKQYDKVIIEPTVYLKPQAFHDNVELILKQMKSGDVIVLPQGFTAKIIRRDAVLFEDQKGETDDN